jgi:Dyp-type peroxidase family
MADPNAIDTIELEQIQGNILGGFNKDFQEFLFLNFPNPASGRNWLETIINDVATSDEVLTFNKLFKKIQDRRASTSPLQEGTVRATWMNIAFSFRGLEALEVSDDDLDTFRNDVTAQPFVAGMADSGQANENGDVDDSSPDNWVEPLRSTENIHALMILASDDEAELDPNNPKGTLKKRLDDLESFGVECVYRQSGKTRLDAGPDQVGHEHFGFKDGVSQPGIRGGTDPFDPVNNPDQGQPGQDLLRPGEFVRGYHKQDGSTPLGSDNVGEISTSGPDWTKNGSYLVYRRLRQNVKGFNDFVAQQQHDLDGSGTRLTTEMGANLVGRYRSGCPFETVKSLPDFDPLKGDPTVPGTSNSGIGNLRNEVLKDEHINDFEYKDDPQGFLVPRAAHIRKVYPRDAVTPAAPEDNDLSEADTQTHRILRRGIPFGASFVEGSPLGSPHAAEEVFPNDRGLNFLCYQTEIHRQWQFLQQN